MPVKRLPDSNEITIKPVVVEGCMVRSKRHFPDCWKTVLRGGFDEG